MGEAHWMRPEKQMTEVVVAAVGCRRQTTSGGEVTDLTQGQGSSVKSTAPQIGRPCHEKFLANEKFLSDVQHLHPTPAQVLTQPGS